jgi:hypothetical protein
VRDQSSNRLLKEKNMTIKEQIEDLDRRAEALQAKRQTLQAQLAEEHPNLCEECGGRGGEIDFDFGSFFEPPCHDFEECGGCEGKHPLDTTRKMSEEDFEARVLKILETGEFPHPILQEIVGVDQAQDCLGDEHIDLLGEENR